MRGMPGIFTSYTGSQECFKRLPRNVLMERALGTCSTVCGLLSGGVLFTAAKSLLRSVPLHISIES